MRTKLRCLRLLRVVRRARRRLNVPSQPLTGAVAREVSEYLERHACK